MSKTYRLSQENPMDGVDFIPPALAGPRHTKDHRATDSGGSNQRGTSIRRSDVIDLFRGCLLLCIVAGMAYLSSPLTPQLADQSGGVLNWLSRIRYNATPAAWESIGPQGQVRITDYLLSGFLFVQGMSLYFWKRRRSRQEWMGIQRWLRTGKRATILILIGVFLQSIGFEYTRFVFTHPLCILGLSCWIGYLLTRGPIWVQLLWAVLILCGYLCWFEISNPAPSENPVIASTETGFTSQKASRLKWSPTNNAVMMASQEWLRPFPNQPDDRYVPEGRTFFNFLPAIALLLFGHATSYLLEKKDWSNMAKSFSLILGGAAVLLAGWGANLLVSPAIERILSPSWVVIATGISLTMVGLFTLLCEGMRLGSIFVPLRVLGRNSLLIYLSSLWLTGWLGRELWKHLSPLIVGLFSSSFSIEQQLAGEMILACISAIILAEFLDRRKFFLRA